MIKANVNNSTETNGHNEQKIIKIRMNNHNAWWYCFEYNYIDPIIKNNDMNNMNNNNNSNNVDHNPSQNIDGGFIGNINVGDTPKSYNFLCHAPTGGTKSNDCWCFDGDGSILKRNNMVDNNDVVPVLCITMKVV